MIRLCSLALALILVSPAFAQANCPVPQDLQTQVRFAAERGASADLSLSDMTWFEGDWVGYAFGLTVNHVVLDEEAGQLPGIVRLYNDDGIAFYEFSAFLMLEGRLAYRNRLFTGGLDAMESAGGEMMTRFAVAAEEGAVFFDGITFARQNDDCMVVSFRLPSPDGPMDKQIIQFQRRR